MGIRMPIEEWPVGDRCNCHPQADRTPQKIYAVFSCIEQCPEFLLPPNDHVFTLYQDEESPCKWANQVNAFGWIVELEWQCALSQVQLLLYRGELEVYFFGLLSFPVIEHDRFANWWVVCGGNQTGKKGCGQVFWNEAALELIENLNIPNDGNTFMEFFVAGEDRVVYKFCNVKYGLNQKCAVEVRTMMPGMILMWHGSIETIPCGWHLCDGDEGTPDLRGKFVPCCGGPFSPGETGGAPDHKHAFAGIGHLHDFGSGTVLESDHPTGVYSTTTLAANVQGETDDQDNLPIFKALCYIMKL